MKRILIIGANSAFAKAVIPILAEDNQVITAGKSGCDVHCDITKKVIVPSDIDVVINFAASFGGASDQDIQDALDVNVLGALRICQAAKEAQVEHFINISSGFAGLDKRSSSYSIYALTKKQADELAEFYCDLNKILFTALRPSRLYGDDGSFAKHQPFFYQIIDKAEKGEDILIYGHNDAVRNYIHTDDLAKAIELAVKQQVGGIYDCSYPSDVTYSEVARAAQKAFNKGGQVKFLADKPDIPNDSFSKDQTLYEKLDYYPSISIEAGMQRIKEHKEGA